MVFPRVDLKVRFFPLPLRRWFLVGVGNGAEKPVGENPEAYELRKARRDAMA
jgi:hypothetical protein